GFYEGEEVRLERRGERPETLVIADSAFLESLHDAAPHVGLRLHDPRHRRARLRLTVAAAAGGLGLTGAIHLWGLPPLTAVAAARVPVAWEESVGQAAIAHLAPAELRCADPKLGDVTAEMVRRLTAAGPPSPYTMHVYVVNRPVVNALAVPGGHIVVFRGLLQRTRTPEEMAGV